MCFDRSPFCRMNGMNKLPHKNSRVKRLFGDQRSHIHCIRKPVCRIYAVRFKICGVGAAAPHRSEVVPLPADDLRIKDAQQSELEIFMGGGIHQHLIWIDHPIERAPDLTPHESLGTFSRVQSADGFHHPQNNRDMRIMLVRKVMGVHIVRFCGAQDLHKIFDGFLSRRVLKCGAGQVQHDLRGELAHICRLALFMKTHSPHLIVCVILIKAIARRPSTIRDNNACEPFIALLKTLQDRLRRHDLNIVLMRGKA